MDFLELAKARYSCKKFSDKPVEKEKLEQILEAGRLAPTAKNNQPQHIYVLSSKESLALADLAQIARCISFARESSISPSWISTL